MMKQLNLQKLRMVKLTKKVLQQLIKAQDLKRALRMKQMMMKRLNLQKLRKQTRMVKPTKKVLQQLICASFSKHVGLAIMYLSKVSQHFWKQEGCVRSYVKKAPSYCWNIKHFLHIWAFNGHFGSVQLKITLGKRGKYNTYQRNTFAQ